MLGSDDDGDITAYGPLPWIAGYILAALLAAVMFGLATGFL